jgi:hypothetical protein
MKHHPHPSTQQWIQYATIPCRSDAANPKPDYHYSKHSSSAKPAPVDKHKEFMSHRPPTYFYSTDTLDVDDWLKTVTKKLEMTQCIDREMVLYTTGCL